MNVNYHVVQEAVKAASPVIREPSHSDIDAEKIETLTMEVENLKVILIKPIFLQMFQAPRIRHFPFVFPPWQEKVTSIFIFFGIWQCKCYDPKMFFFSLMKSKARSPIENIVYKRSF